MVYGRSIAVGVCLMTIVALYSGLIFYLSLGKLTENQGIDFKLPQLYILLSFTLIGFAK